MDKKLDARLRAVLESIPACETLVDVGCDHGYVSIYAAERGLAKKITASDINEGPLENARKEIKAAGQGDKIETVLTDGLSGIEHHDCVVIAGMGGETIADIISRAEWTKKNCTLVLQPMTRSEILREYLYREGFSIKREKFVSHNGHMYCIITAHFDGKDGAEPFEKYISRAGLMEENAHEYIEKVTNRLSYEFENRKRAGVLGKDEEEEKRRDIEEMEKLCRQ